MRRQVIPLTQAKEGQRLAVVSLGGGHGFRRRLAELGMNPAIPLTVLRNRGGSPLVIELRGSRLMLGRGVANRILVSPL